MPWGNARKVRQGSVTIGNSHGPPIGPETQAWKDCHHMSNTIRKVEAAAANMTPNIPVIAPSAFSLPVIPLIAWPSLSLRYSQHYSIHPS